MRSVDVGGFWEEGDEGSLDFVADFPDGHADSDHKLLPKTVADWAGITKKAEHALSQMNDFGHTFKEIALLIRAVILKEKAARRRARRMLWNAPLGEAW